MRNATHLEPIGAAGHGREDVVAVHGPEDEAGSVPGLVAVDALHRGAALEAAHAHGRQVLRPVVDLNLKRTKTQRVQ